MKTKVCCECKKEKTVDQFGKYSKTLDGLQYKCRPCQREYGRRFYQENGLKEKQLARRNRIKRKVFNYISNNSCVDCGESDPIVLEFDHRDEEDKEYNISHMVTEGFSIDNIMLEIAKCDVRCANCHRRRTAEQQGWYSFREVM